ncbi:MAG: Hpt domain-containing protein [Candidatus Acidiferrum sp.]
MKETEEILSTPIWNQAELLERVDNDLELLRELLIIYKAEFPRTIQSLQSAVAGGELKNTASLSHSLKGMLSNLGGGRAAAAAEKLEELAVAGENALLKEALDTLQREAARLLPELDAYMMEVRH